MSARVQAEASLQDELLLRLRIECPAIMTFVTPNGITVPGGDPRTIAMLKGFMKRKGMLIPGASDILLLWDGGCALAETKRPAFKDVFGHHAAGTPSEDQRAFAKRANSMGIPHRYVRSWDALKEFLQECNAPI